MGSLRAVAGVMVVGLALALSACAPSAEVENIAVSANDVQGEVVEVALNQVLYINTSDLDTDIQGFTATITDESIVTFESGHDAGDFGVYPAFTPLRVGRTEVTMTGGADSEPLEFTIEVTR